MAERAQAIVIPEETAREQIAAPVPASVTDLADSPAALHQSRVSWLQFNRRFWKRRETPTTRCSKRMRFLSISANNLDEFFMVRVAGLKGQVREGITTAKPRWIEAGRAAERDHRCRSVLAQRSAGRAGRNCARSSPAGHRAGGRHSADQERRGLARGIFPAAHLSGADAARHRSGAPVPVHSQSRFHDRLQLVRAARRRGR